MTYRSETITVVSNSYQLSHIFKILEKVVDLRMRQCINIHGSQFGFMPTDRCDFHTESDK